MFYHLKKHIVVYKISSKKNFGLNHYLKKIQRLLIHEPPDEALRKLNEIFLSLLER